jgi:hypothetical protein
MDSRSVVRRRVAADPSPFSPSFPIRFLSTATPNSCQAFHTSGTRESCLFKFHPLHSFACKAHSWRYSHHQTLSNLRSPSSLREYHLILHYDCLLGRLFTCYGSRCIARPFASSVDRRQRSPPAAPVVRRQLSPAALLPVVRRQHSPPAAPSASRLAL